MKLGALEPKSSDMALPILIDAWVNLNPMSNTIAGVFTILDAFSGEPAGSCLQG